MPVGWPLHIDGAVRQRCIHRDTTLQELDDLLSEYDMKRDLAEIYRKAPQWSHKAVWNKWYMEPKAGLTLSQMWINAEADITQKTSRSNEIRDSDLRRVASADFPAPKMEPESAHVVSAVSVHWLQCGDCDAARPRQHTTPGQKFFLLTSCSNPLPLDS